VVRVQTSPVGANVETRMRAALQILLVSIAYHSLRVRFRLAPAVLCISPLLIYPGAVLAISCTSTNITLESQSQVNSFQSVYGPCDTVDGELTIGGVWAQPSDIGNLLPLSNLVAIQGLLRIESTNLTEFDGLQGLEALAGLYLYDNLHLENVDVFAGISGISGPLEISKSPLLSNIDGLANIEFVGGSLSLSDLPLIDNLHSFLSLESLSSNLQFGGIFLRNLGVTDISGLQNILVFNGQLRLTANAKLTSLNGFPQSITSLQTLFLLDNANLSDISALSLITEINGDYPEGNFFIKGSSLRRLTGLENLERVNQSFTLIGNSMLRDCTALKILFDEKDDGNPGPNIAPIPDVLGGVSFTSNAGTCNSWQGMFDYLFWDDFE